MKNRPWTAELKIQDALLKELIDKTRELTFKEMGEWLYNNRGTVSYLTPQEVEALRQGRAPWEMPPNGR